MIYLKKGRCCQAYSEKGAGLSCCVFVPMLGAPMDKPIRFPPPTSELHGLGPFLTKSPVPFFIFMYLNISVQSLVTGFLLIFCIYTNVFINLYFHS